MNKNSTVIIDDIHTRALPYLERKKPISSLNFKEPMDQSIVKYLLDRRPGFISELNPNDPLHVNLLKGWVTEDYANYISIVNNGFESVELLAIYLFLKFKSAKSNKYSIMRSFTKQTVISYRYETKKGETIAYFDKTLGVPSILKVVADVKIKITNPDYLLKAVDIDIAMVDLFMVMDHVNRIFNDTLRDCTLEYIIKNGLSYYQLSQHYTALSNIALHAMNAAFEKEGLQVADVSIVDITIPNNTNEMFERQFFAIAEAKRVKDFENKQAQASLELYEKKAAIHSKYPEFPVTLTESEKDFALNRYLKRNGIDKKLVANIKSDELAEKEEQSEGTLTAGKLVKPVAPIPPKASSFRKVYFILLIVCIIISSVMFVAGVGAALISYGVTMLIFGLIAVVNMNALKHGKQDEKAAAEYQKQYEEYKREYANYMATKNENEINNIGG